MAACPSRCAVLCLKTLHSGGNKGRQQMYDRMRFVVHLGMRIVADPGAGG